MVVVAITGMPLSGKSVATEFFISRGFETIILKELVRELMVEKGMDITNESYRTFATELRRERGMDAVARLALPMLQKLRGRNVVFDGVRGMEEVSLFREDRNDFILLAVWSPFSLRFGRALVRRREDEALTEESFRWRDHVEIGWGIPACVALADYLLVNDRSKDDFLTALGGCFQKWK